MSYTILEPQGIGVNNVKEFMKEHEVLFASRIGNNITSKKWVITLAGVHKISKWSINPSSQNGGYNVIYEGEDIDKACEIYNSL